MLDAVVHGRGVDEAIAKLRLRPVFRAVYAVGHTASRRGGRGAGAGEVVTELGRLATALS